MTRSRFTYADEVWPVIDQETHEPVRLWSPFYSICEGVPGWPVPYAHVWWVGDERGHLWGWSWTLDGALALVRFLLAPETV